MGPMVGMRAANTLGTPTTPMRAANTPHMLFFGLAAWSGRTWEGAVGVSVPPRTGAGGQGQGWE
eukprot:317098-Chlamydomonas_euryale.AAC.1